MQHEHDTYCRWCGDEADPEEPEEHALCAEAIDERPSAGRPRLFLVHMAS